MRNFLVELAGVLALAASVTHGVLGETKVFRRARIEPERLRLLIRLVWQCSTIAWMSLGVLLIVTPRLGPDARFWIVAASAVTFGLAAAGNAWATRGQHFGWVVLVAVVGLAAAGM